MNTEITALPKEQWKGTAIPLTTRNDSYYDVEIKLKADEPIEEEKGEE